MMKSLILCLSLLFLAGCSGGAVVFLPTALPADISPTTYTHPSGAFAIVVPRNWSVYEQGSGQIASASFSPPGSNTPVVSISIVNLGASILNDQLGALMLQYQTQIRPDLTAYSEQNREALGDGSWRITGVRSTEGVAETLNTFLQKQDNLFAVLEVVVPRDAALATDVQTFVNTLQLNPASTLSAATMSALTIAAQAELELVHVATWANSDGVFFITGEVANRSAQDFANVPIEGRLVDANGATVTSATDTVIGHAVLRAGYAPFSLRFGGGQPVEAVNFALALGGRDAIQSVDDVVSAPALVWTDVQQTGTEGQFYIEGTVTNTGNVPLRDVRAIATVFDANGDVIGAAYAATQSPMLAPGASSPYTILVQELGGTPTQYIVVVQGLGGE